MNEITQRKARSILRAIDGAADWSHQDAANLLACLTSPSKDDREKGKQGVRLLVDCGNAIETHELNMYLAAMAANRFEP